MRLAALACLVLALAACGGGPPSEAENEAFIRTLENIAEAKPAPEANAQEALPPQLLPLAQGEPAQALGDAPGCDFSIGGRILFAATGQSGIARINGQLVRLASPMAAGATGGFFTGREFSVSVGRLVDSGVVVAGTTSWPAHLLLTDRSRDGAEARLQGAWRCPTDAG
jgi:hypothetical protein